VRSDVSGPSSGISTAFDDCLADEARVDLRVPVLDLRATDAVEVRVERVDVRPGIFCCILSSVWGVVGVS
jgi:hypothetical protein